MFHSSVFPAFSKRQLLAQHFGYQIALKIASRSRVSTAMESIRLWLALTPKQFEDLNNGKEVQPDEYSKRFGLRKDPIAAVERAQYFNDWTPEGPKGEFCAKDYVLVEVELTAIGYLQKAEAGILLKCKPNEYRWQGTMKALEFDENGNPLYKFGSEAMKIV